MKTPVPAHWPEALATVTACRYQFGAGRALAFGIPASKHFLVTFNYEVDGEMHTGQMLSAKAMPQGELFPIHFDPERPAANTHGGPATLARATWLGVGLAGSLVLSLVWWFLVRGCS